MHECKSRYHLKKSDSKRLKATQPTFQDTIVNVSRISCQNESEKIKFFPVNNGSRLRAFIVAMNDDYVFYTGLTSARANGDIHIRLHRPFQTHWNEPLIEAYVNQYSLWKKKTDTTGDSLILTLVPLH